MKVKAVILTVSTLLLIGLSGCGSIIPRSSSATALDDFGSSEVYSRAFPGTSTAACEASRRALLSQGYIIEEAQAANVKAHKNFQPGPESHVEVRFTVTCAKNSKGSHTATIFANAVKERYSLRKSSNSASVGFGALASLSLPLTSSDDAMVKVASETVSSQKFYGRFFDTVERYLDVSVDQATPETRDGKSTAKPVEESVSIDDLTEEEPPAGKSE